MKCKAHTQSETCSSSIIEQARLVIDGGKPVCQPSLPTRHLIGTEERDAVAKLFDSVIASGNCFAYNGAAEKEYESFFVDYMGGGFADGVNSGTNALFCALGALQLEPFSEVILPPITDNGGFMPALFLNLVPMVADADPRSYNTCADEIAPLITERTRAVVVAHIAGEPVDMDPIMKLARKHNLYVVEDCAQSHGAEYKGTLVGKIGHIAAFSTMAGKHHCTGGQGGVVYTMDENLFWQAKRFADRGKPFNSDSKKSLMAGLNCNLNDLSATIGAVQIRKLPESIKKRRQIASQFREGIKNSRALSMGWEAPESRPSYWYLRVKFHHEAVSVSKEQFCKALEAEGVAVDPCYYHIPCSADWFKNKQAFGNNGFPWDCSDYHGSKEPVYKIVNAEKAVADHFNIWIFESYQPDHVQCILDAVSKVETFFSKGK